MSVELHVSTSTGGADKSLAWPTSQCILFDGENILFDASLVMYINSTNTPPIMIINRIYQNQNLLSLQLISFLVGLRTYQHPCKFYILSSYISSHHFMAKDRLTHIYEWVTNTHQIKCT